MFRPIREVVIQGGGGRGAINSKDYHNDNPQSKEKCQYIKLSFNYHAEAKNYLEFSLLQKKDEKSSPGYIINCMLGD